MLSTVRRHSLRLQTELHRWSICDPGSHLLPDRILARVPTCISRSKSCASSAGESDGSRGSWSSSDSVISTDSAGEAAEPGSSYRVVLLGASGVGKTAFASIFAGAADSMDSDDCELCGDEMCEKVIEVDGEAATVTLLDTWDAETDSGWAEDCHMQTGDAYLLLYSITDRASFLRASELRITLRRFRPAQHTPIILVGNKCDLVRRREVSVSEGRACAVVFDCKFIETSAAMQHNVWEAFRGIVRQLRLRRDSREANKRRRHINCSARRESFPMKAKRFFDKVVAKNNPSVAFWLKSKSCHDLSVLDSLDLPSKTVTMTPMVHLLLLPLLFSIAGGKNLEEKKGPYENTVLDVPEGTPVPYPIHQFQVTNPGVNNFRLSGEGSEDIKISTDGWLYLEKPLNWSREDHYIVKVEALADDEAVEGAIYVTINVLDINNNAPYFNQSEYIAAVRENSAAGSPFTRVFALDHDDPETPNAHLSYSLVSQIPNKNGVLFFQINPNTGEISTTEEGQKMLKARDGIQFSKGEVRSIDTLKTKFDDYCPGQDKPYEQNPFFTCVERAEMRRWNVDPVEDPDYILFVRVQDLGGASVTALSGNAKVDIVVEQNLWVNPGPITIKEHSEETYPLAIAKVQSNDPHAIYSLVQKERAPRFPFQISSEGEIFLTEPLDREVKDMYILVVFAKDIYDNEIDPPMEIHVLVKDINDNAPVCGSEESIFEVQEDEPIGSPIGQLLAYDDDEEGTLNSLLTYSILSQEPPTTPNAFSIDASGKIQSLRLLQRKDHKIYNLNVRVNDPVFSTECKVTIKVIDVNNEIPLFEKNDYGNHSLTEDTPDPVPDHIWQRRRCFSVKTDGSGVGYVVINKPLDFESSPSYKLQIDARNPEPLTKGMEYGHESTAFVSVFVTDIDEDPEFSLDISDVTVPENTTKGSVLLTVEAKDPEGKEIGFKLEGDTQGWLEIDAATGQIKTKDKLDRETLESFQVTVTAFEKENPKKFSERVVYVRLLDVNDNVPKLKEIQAFICVKKPKPVIIEAYDTDDAPFSQPFDFTLAHSRKSPNWELQRVDGTKAKLTLKKAPTEDKTFILPINIKDNKGMGVTQSFQVRVCNCTELGYCYIAPVDHSFRFGMGPTIGILAGTLGFCIIVFIIVIKRINKKGKKTKTLAEEEERSMM
ncbi:hypothetical protein Q5P01_011205 [Channa striata]|uniref:Cadherin domain-containing protein n=1 Tax=Channa striata TaxID=64152 RepID=A0AA88MTF5_CHASR|nr:hypothetical protein Q5P01_011205 [Channa striata]